MNKYKVRINNQYWEHASVEADEFIIEHGSLIFYKVTVQERIVEKPNEPFMVFPAKVYPYSYTETKKEKLALFGPGQWVYVTNDNSSNSS